MNPSPPAKTVPLLYLGTAHVALALAALLAALWPAAVAGFFYHSWMVAIVHLVTLGWITFSILGAIYIVGPVALRMEMPARRLDYWAWAAAVVGLAGMVGHFWIQEYGGMAWSAGTVAIGVLYMTVRIVRAIQGAHVHNAVRIHITLASVNFWIAAGMGVLIAIDKAAHILPGFVLANVFAHVHAAAIGWAVMMVVGVGYRLLPMTFPSKMPARGSMYSSAALLETGVIGLFVTLLFRSNWTVVFGVCILAGLAVFGAHVVWMLRRPVPRPVGAARIDFGVLHAVNAGLSLVGAAAIGIVLLVAPQSPQTLHAAAAYGVLGLVGFLAQMIVAMETRLIPTATWYWAYAATGYTVPPASPHVMRDRALQALAYIGWTIAVPLLTAGMYRESAPLVAVGAWSLFAGVAIGTIDNIVVVGNWGT